MCPGLVLAYSSMKVIISTCSETTW